MKISQLYVYPIKSLRPHKLSSAEATYSGFRYDRTFILLNVVGPGTAFRPMQVAHTSEMVLFHTEIIYPTENDCTGGKVIVTFNDPAQEKVRQLEIPLQPNCGNLDTLEVDLYGSVTKAYDMGNMYNEWFRSCFDFPNPVILAYLGENKRPALGNISPRVAGPQQAAANRVSTWMSSLTSRVPYMSTSYPGVDEGLTFVDVAPYLVVSETSWQNVNTRLEIPEPYDITKFRPNIVVTGADEEFEEDYWAELAIRGVEESDEVGRGSSLPTGSKELKMVLTQNCARCTSLTVDFATGKFATGKAGSMLKVMQKDRRVDQGAKWSPVFGRYGFLDRAPEGSRIHVGDEVIVTRRNRERTRFEWPSLST